MGNNKSKYSELSRSEKDDVLREFRTIHADLIYDDLKEEVIYDSPFAKLDSFIWKEDHPREQWNNIHRIIIQRLFQVWSEASDARRRIYNLEEELKDLKIKYALLENEYSNDKLKEYKASFEDKLKVLTEMVDELQNKD